MGKKGPLWWRESDWLLRGSSAANQILLRHSGPLLSGAPTKVSLYPLKKNSNTCLERYFSSLLYYSLLTLTLGYGAESRENTAIEVAVHRTGTKLCH